MKPLVTVIEPEGPESWFTSLSEVCSVRFFYPDGPVTPQQIDDLVRDSDAIIITSATALSNEQLKAAPRLQIIAKCGGPPSNIDVEFAARCGIAVTYVPRANTNSIAEYTIMLIIAAMRRFDLHSQVIRRGQWRAPGFLLGKDLRDCVVGIVGLGAIGTEVARLLRAFGCRILVYSPHARRDGDNHDLKFCESLNELLSACDVITVHSKVTPQTNKMFDASAFARMKQSAVFINTARGALVDEDALASALSSGRLSAAAVDVFDTEPPSADNPLMSCENAILTPHSSGWTEGALWRECNGAVASVLAFYRGQEIPGLLNADYKMHM